MKGKKIASVALAGLLGVSLASCSKDNGPKWVEAGDVNNTNVQTSVDKVKGYKSFVEADNAERTEILGKLEEYAAKNRIAGLTLFDDGGFSKVASRVEIPTKLNGLKVGTTEQHEYVLGYGFGIVQEGKLNGHLDGAKTYKDYYHTFETSDPASLNGMNDKGSVVAGYAPYVAATYFDNRLNATKDNYEYFHSLATTRNTVDGKPRPIPVIDGKEKTDSLKVRSTKYRLYVKTGKDAKYGTKSSKMAKYNGREVKLEDYITPYKELWNQSNGLARGGENLTGAQSIKGAKEYYDATKSGFSQEAWDKVGIKSGANENGSYIEFEFNNPCTPFYAMYYTNSTQATPIPAEFLEEIGGIKVWGSYNTDKTITPIDSTLATGPYVVEAWESDKEFVFGKNEQCLDEVKGGSHRYQIPGIHVAILKAAEKDPLAAWKEFSEAKTLDTCGIPKDKLTTERETPGTQTSKGSSTTKLNLNTCTPEEWEYLFGTNGVVTQTPQSEYYQVKPIMSNDDFLAGLSYAIDRKEYANNRGRTPSLEYFSENYMSDPDNNISYNKTDVHNNVMTSVYGADWKTTYGYNRQKAVESFKKAAEKLVADGKYKAGDTVEISIWWQAEAQIKSMGADLSKYIEEAWNAAGAPFKLVVKNEAVTEWSDIYYKKMMVGQFDIAFGGISGNPLNPLNFMEVLKSDNSSGFTLNWGPNTNSVEDAAIEYKGETFTFDSLYQAADTGTVLAEDGSKAKLSDAALLSNVKNADGSRTVKVKLDLATKGEDLTNKVGAVVLAWYESSANDDGYEETALTDFKYNNGVLEVTISKELVELYKGQVTIDIVTVATPKGQNPLKQVHSLPLEFWFQE